VRKILPEGLPNNEPVYFNMFLNKVRILEKPATGENKNDDGNSGKHYKQKPFSSQEANDFFKKGFHRKNLSPSIPPIFGPIT
jgi:hypothetical protein